MAVAVSLKYCIFVVFIFVLWLLVGFSFNLLMNFVIREVFFAVRLVEHLNDPRNDSIHLRLEVKLFFFLCSFYAFHHRIADGCTNDIIRVCACVGNELLKRFCADCTKNLLKGFFASKGLSEIAENFAKSLDFLSCQEIFLFES